MASRNPAIAAIAGNPEWFPHRFDPEHDAVHFVDLPRRVHRAATFITDDYLPADAARMVVLRSDACANALAPGPIHFILHSAYCCSTLLARALDIDGVAMGLKEPVLLNDLVGWSHRGARPADVAAVLDDGLALLSRPFSPGEAVVIKPSNVVNAMAPAMLAVRPHARALLLYAPLKVYLGSIARKGMWGRLWVRELLVKQLRDRLIEFGFSPEDYLGQTDLQVAAIGWLAQQALFARLVATLVPTRVRTLDSERLVAEPHAAMTALATLFKLKLDAGAVDRIVAGPAFTQDSKSGQDFGATMRARAAHEAAPFADEIDKVTTWAEAVAASAGLDLTLAAPLI